MEGRAFCSECGERPTCQVDQSTYFCAKCYGTRFCDSDLPKLTAGFRGLIDQQVDHCPFCGTTVSDVEVTGLAGCPLCYVALPDKLWYSRGLRQ